MIELVAVAGFVAFCSAMFFLVWAANRDKVPARTADADRSLYDDLK